MKMVVCLKITLRSGMERLNADEYRREELAATILKSGQCQQSISARQLQQLLDIGCLLEGAEKLAGGGAEPRSGAAGTTGPGHHAVRYEGRMPEVCEKPADTHCKRVIRTRLSHAFSMRPWAKVHHSPHPVVPARQASLHHRLISLLLPGAPARSILSHLRRFVGLSLYCEILNRVLFAPVHPQSHCITDSQN